MKKILWLLPLFFWCSLKAQVAPQSFVIIHSGQVRNISDYVNALNHNDLDKYRNMDERTTMYFKEGVEVQLLSAKELRNMGLPVDMNKVNQKETGRMRHSQFTLHPSGRILESITPLKKGQ